MNIKLSDNIRAFRKSHSLTQQQLADALGVTVGAVYKWEARLSAPDLSLLVELADLFDTSVDVLLGYEVKSNKHAVTVARLNEYLLSKDQNGLAEAEKALLRYPNRFDVVHLCAKIHYLFGFMSHDELLLRRCIELWERSLLLMDQNTDPEISELSIYSDMAVAYSSLGEEEKALEILKRNNPRGINNDVIGFSLAGTCNRPNEAVEYLSMALTDVLTRLAHIAYGYMNVYFKKDDYATGESILRAALDFFSGLKKPGEASFLDKLRANFTICLALAQLKQGKDEDARQSLLSAKRLAEDFDRNPDYTMDSIRFVHTAERQTAFDDLGDTAMESVLNALRAMDSDVLTAMWENIQPVP